MPSVVRVAAEIGLAGPAAVTGGSALRAPFALRRRGKAWQD
ncbi:hypothetical protein [Tropicimonas sp. IMCC34011]|nr:hypothetical protein [Tropicimonas sp. IMCC34011]